jgi:hypothetical protein
MVLLCYDGSPTAKRAVSIAHEVLGDTRATVLHVWQPPGEFLSPDWFAAPVAPPIAGLEALALENAERVAALDSHLFAERARRVSASKERAPGRTSMSSGRDEPGTLGAEGR